MEREVWSSLQHVNLISLPVHSCQVTHGVGKVHGSATSLWVLQHWTVWVKSKVETVNPVLGCQAAVRWGAGLPNSAGRGLSAV